MSILLLHCMTDAYPNSWTTLDSTSCGHHRCVFLSAVRDASLSPCNRFNTYSIMSVVLPSINSLVTRQVLEPSVLLHDCLHDPRDYSFVVDGLHRDQLEEEGDQSGEDNG